MAATASRMPSLTSLSRNGSTAVEFSGQSTKSGRTPSDASRIVASTWLRVTPRWS
jgi:hypothetical protein